MSMDEVHDQMTDARDAAATQKIEAGSVWAKHGEKIATQAMRAVLALQRADWISPDEDNEDLADACMIIADAFAEAS